MARAHALAAATLLLLLLLLPNAASAVSICDHCDCRNTTAGTHVRCSRVRVPTLNFVTIFPGGETIEYPADTVVFVAQEGGARTFSVPAATLPNLEFLDLSNSFFGPLTLDFSGFSKLKELILDGVPVRPVGGTVTLTGMQDAVSLTRLSMQSAAADPADLATSLDGLPLLEELDLRGRFKNLANPAFPRFNLPALRKLNLLENNLAAPARRDFNDVTNLEILEMSAADLGSGIGKLTNLQTLRVDDFTFTQLGDDAFPLPQLTKLTLVPDQSQLDTGVSQLSALAFASTPLLTHLNLQANRLSNDAWPAFAHLRNLESLELDDNLFQELPAGAFGNMTQLKVLNLAGNDNLALAVDNLEPFAQLINLEQLFLANTRVALTATTFQQALPRLQRLELESTPNGQLSNLTFVGLPALEYLDLSDTDTETLAPGLFAPLGNLKELLLSQNNLERIRSGDLTALASLETLRVVDNANFVGFDEGALASLLSLRTLDVRNNNIATLSPNLLRGLTSLRSLTLAGQAQLTSLPDDLFVDNTQLTFIEISRTSLAALPPMAFQLLTQLETLNLNDNMIAAVGADAFRTLGSLRRLNLANNKLTRLPANLLLGVPFLTVMNFEDNLISEIEPFALPQFYVQTSAQTVLSMGGTNPSSCVYQAGPATSPHSAFASLACTCTAGFAGHGFFCSPEAEVLCTAGTVLEQCNDCAAGTYTPFDFNGTECPVCAAGHVDNDLDPATPCVQCTEPGLIVPAGSTGPCSSPAFQCAPGTVKRGDAAPEDPCQDVCDVCACNGKTTDCSGQSLTAIPRGLPLTTETLILSNNALTDLDADVLGALPNLNQVTAADNRIGVISEDMRDLASKRNLALELRNNPSFCTVQTQFNSPPLITCVCGQGFAGDGTYCDVAPIAIDSGCPAGFVDHDTDDTTPCQPCLQPGVYVPPNSRGICDSYVCAPGTTDHDNDPATPCVACLPGTVMLPGSSGPCSAHRCPAGTTDHDAVAASPCVRCRAGEYTAAGSFGSCQGFECRPGTVDDDYTAATECVTCPEGTAVIFPALTGPCANYLCPNGTTDHDLNPTTACFDLPPGTFAAAGTALPVALLRCPAGTVDDDSDPATECVVCSGSGLFVPPGSVGACDRYACPLGQFDHDDNASTPCQLVPPPSKSKSSDDNSVAIGVGVALPLILLVLVLLCLLKRARDRAPAAVAHEFDAELEQISVGRSKIPPREIPRQQITMLEKLGAGAFGTVNKALLDERTELGVPSYLVAIKEFPELSAKERDAVFLEAAVMAQIKHDHVIQLVGVVTKGLPIYIVLQFCEHGSLDHFLREQGMNLLLNSKLQIIHDVASGMAQLASLGFVHRDLAARNVLVSSDLRCKVSDFGHARDIADEGEYISGGGVVAVRWTAPEALAEKKFCEKSDIWSYGVVIYEVWTNGEVPYKNMSNEQVWLEVANGFRLGRPVGCPNHIYKLAKNCWNKDPAARPTFSELHAYIRDLLNGDMTALMREWQYLSASQNSRKSGTLSASSGVSSMNTLSTSANSENWSADSGTLQLPGDGASSIPAHMLYADMGDDIPEEGEEEETVPKLFVPPAHGEDDEDDAAAPAAPAEPNNDDDDDDDQSLADSPEKKLSMASVQHVHANDEDDDDEVPPMFTGNVSSDEDDEGNGSNGDTPPLQPNNSFDKDGAAARPALPAGDSEQALMLEKVPGHALVPAGIEEHHV